MFDEEFGTVSVEAPKEDKPRDDKGRFVSKEDKEEERHEEQEAKFERVIDLGDGSGPQVFRGETQEELIDALTKAQENATRKIRELNRKVKRASLNPPSMARKEETPKRAPKTISDDEAFLLGQQFQTNPVAAFEKLSEVTLGYKPAEIAERLSRAERMEKQAQETEAAIQFMNEYGDEYLPSPENYNALKNYLDAHGLEMTAATLADAFENLSSSGLLEMPSGKEGTENEEPSSRIENERKPASGAPKKKVMSGISNRSAQQEDLSDLNIPTDEELDRLPYEVARQRILETLHKAKTRNSR